MALRINQSGTWRNITVQCVNQSGTWRRVVDGCVNQSGTWRCFGMTAPTVSLSRNQDITRCVTTTSTLSWSTTKASSVSSNFGATALSGNCVVSPSSTTTYSMCATNSFGTSSTASATVTVSNPALGSSVGGGRLVCASAGVFWIVAPNTSQVARSWYCRNDANTRAQQVSGCTGWFVPDVFQIQNPGYTCRTYWDSYSALKYWSSSEFNIPCAWAGKFYGAGSVYGNNKSDMLQVRAFRCVTY